MFIPNTNSFTGSKTSWTLLLYQLLSPCLFFWLWLRHQYSPHTCRWLSSSAAPESLGLPCSVSVHLRLLRFLTHINMNLNIVVDLQCYRHGMTATSMVSLRLASTFTGSVHETLLHHVIFHLFLSYSRSCSHEKLTWKFALRPDLRIQPAASTSCKPNCTYITIDSCQCYPMQDIETTKKCCTNHCSFM